MTKRPLISGYPLWAWLRAARAVHPAKLGASKIDYILKGSIVPFGRATKTALAQELLYRFVRRNPGRLLAIDGDAIIRFFYTRYGARPADHTFVGFGFLVAVPLIEWVRPQVCVLNYTKHKRDRRCTFDRALVRRAEKLFGPLCKKKMAQMSPLLRQAFVLTKELEVLL